MNPAGDEYIDVVRRVVRCVEGDTSILCRDLAIIAPDLPQLHEWGEWLWRRQNSALRIQRTSTERLELLIQLGTLLDDLETRTRRYGVI